MKTKHLHHDSKICRLDHEWFDLDEARWWEEKRTADLHGMVTSSVDLFQRLLLTQHGNWILHQWNDTTMIDGDDDTDYYVLVSNRFAMDWLDVNNYLHLSSPLSSSTQLITDSQLEI